MMLVEILYFYALQNDFSYYRRTTQRLRNSQNQNANEETSSELESIPMNTCTGINVEIILLGLGKNYDVSHKIIQTRNFSEGN